MEKENHGVKLGEFLKVLDLFGIDAIHVHHATKHKDLLDFDFDGVETYDKKIGFINPLIARMTITDIKFHVSTDSRMPYMDTRLSIWCK